MQTLHPLDYGIIVVYFVVTLVVGLVMTRFASRSLDDYFLGGRKLPWYLLGIAGMTGWFDMSGTMIITSFLYLLGPRGLFIEFRGGAVLILAFLLVYAGKWHRRSGCMTAAEWMTYRFGLKSDATTLRVVMAANNILGTVVNLGYFVVGARLFMGLVFPFPPLYTTIFVFAISTLYTMLAGFYGVVLTDLLQGLIIMVACVIVGLLAWFQVPDAAALGALAERVTGNAQWLSSLPHWQTQMPPGHEQYQLLFLFALFYLLRNVLGGMGSGAESRYFGARSDRDCGMQSLLQGITVAFRWPMMMGFAVLGIFLVNRTFPDMNVLTQAADVVKAHYPRVEPALWHELTDRMVADPQKYDPAAIAELQAVLGADWQRKLPLVSYRGNVDPENILPAVMLTLPAGLKGLIIVALLAALMSTVTGWVNGTSALFVKDLYQLLIRPRAGHRELLWMSYLSTAAIVAGGMWMGYAATSINQIWGWIIMGLGAGGLGPNLARLYWWRCNAWGMFGGTILGGVGAVVQKLVAPEMHEWNQFLLMTALSFLGTIIGSLATAPTPTERLRHFYRTTRPFGLWGPVRATFSPAEQRALTAEHRNDLIAVPFALLWQITLFLLPMQLVIKAYTSFLWTLPLFLVGSVGMYCFWYRVLPPATPPAPAAGTDVHGTALAGAGGVSSGS